MKPSTRSLLLVEHPFLHHAILHGEDAPSSPILMGIVSN